MRRIALLLLPLFLLAFPSPSIASEPRPDFRAPWPCGEVRDYFHHSTEVVNAIDYIIPGAGLGTPVLASFGGTVVSAMANGGYGNEVVVDHGGGWRSRVAHLSAFSVTAGQAVSRGQELGKVGSTGNSSGPHLHYEQIADGQRVPIVIDGSAMRYDGNTYRHTSNNCNSVPRFAFTNADGVVFGKDGPYAGWSGGFNAGGGSKVVMSGDWIGWLENGNFYAKDGIYASWKNIWTDGTVRDIAIDGNRFGFVNAAGQVRVKDGVDAEWPGWVNAAGATKLVLSGNWIGWLENGNFYVKDGIFSSWRTMAAGGIVDIAVNGNRFGFVNGGGAVILKDGVDAGWNAPINAGGATRLTLSEDWIGWIEQGNFYVKHGIFDTWRTMASGDGIQDIAIGRNAWFAFLQAGNFYAKQGADASWLPMATGGQVRHIAIRT